MLSSHKSVKWAVTAIAAIAAMMLASAAARADIIKVPGDYPTIQEAIDAAVDGDEVEVHPGTYNETINLLGKAITVRSSDGPEVTIIDAQQTGTVVTCTSGEGPDTVVDGFTITGGTGTDPGDGFTRGGGMFNDASSPTVTNCTFTGNSAEFFGGGMSCVNSSPTVTNCTFSGNTSMHHGGGMHILNSSLTVTNCTFSGNSATVGGGGIYNVNSSLTVTNCTFSGNTAVTGGGMSNQSISPTVVTNCTFSGNSATVGGGGMYNSGSPTVTNCTFSGNSAGVFGGGGMFNLGSSPTVTNCTFSGNTATNDGGGMYSIHSSPTIINCILWNNSRNEIFDDPDSVTTARYSDIEQGWPGTGNIDADPLFVDDASGDLHLSAGSPCIDAGNNFAVPFFITTDLDGNPRFVDDPATKDTGFGDPPIVDMGAYEFQVVAPCPWDLDGTSSVGILDLLALLAVWGTDPGGPPDFDGDGTVGILDLLTLLANWGPCA